MSSLSINKAWDESVAFITRNVRVVFPVAMAFFMLPTTLMAWAQPNSAAEEGGLGALFSLMMLLLIGIGQVTIARLALGWEGSIGTAISRAIKRIWPFIAAVILIYLPLVLIGGIIIAILVGASGLTDPAQFTPERIAAIPSVAIGLLVFMLIAVIIATRVMPMSAVTAAEDIGPMALIQRSFALTKGNFWRLLGVLLLLGLASLTVDAGAKFGGGTVVELVIGPMAPFNFSALIVALLTGFFGAAISSISAILTGRIYAQLAAQPTVPDVSLR